MSTDSHSDTSSHSDPSNTWISSGSTGPTEIHASAFASSGSGVVLLEFLIGEIVNKYP